MKTLNLARFPTHFGGVVLEYIIKCVLFSGRVLGVRGGLFLVAIGLLYLYYHNKSLGVLLPIIASIFLTDLLKTIYANMQTIREDKLKTTHNNLYLKEIYNDQYEKRIDVNGTNIEFLYDCCVTNKDYEIVIKDYPEKMFELDPIIKASYCEIMEAHKGSYIKNFETIRLDDYALNSNTLTFMTSRSNFYNHLITNRAIDYEYKKNVSCRKLFEYGPYINKLSNSRMSNHIGLNGIVLLNDGYTLLPRRGSKATYSKNKITASIAAPLTSEGLFKDGGTQELNYDEITNKIRQLLKKRLQIDVENLEKSSVEIKLLGFGREIYEGGKPQFYFLVKLNSVSSQDYMQLLNENRKRAKVKNDIDIDSKVFICDLLSLAVKKNYSGTVKCINHYSDRLRFGSAEFSFFANYWHLEKAGYLGLFNVNEGTNGSATESLQNESERQVESSV